VGRSAGDACCSDGILTSLNAAGSTAFLKYRVVAGDRHSGRRAWLCGAVVVYAPATLANAVEPAVARIQVATAPCFRVVSLNSFE
jgi:hypothetical protein